MDKRIDEIENNEYEIFVWLKKGFILTDQHCFSESTMKEVRESMKLVVPCSCNKCIN